MSRTASATLLSTLCPRLDAPVVLGAGEPIAVETLLRRAAVIAALLPEPRPGSEVAFAFGEDRAAFLAALLGTWIAGHSAALPQDARRENVVPVLSRPDNVEFLHDTGVGRGFWVPGVLAESPLGDLPSWRSIDDDRVVLTAITARAGLQQWTAAALIQEVCELAGRMDLPAAATVVSPLSPTMLEGMMLGMLVPMHSGALFCAEVPRGGAALVQSIHERRAHAVVAAPSHLRQLADLPGGDLEPIEAIFCCAGQVDERLRGRFDRVHSLAVASPMEKPSTDASAALVGALTEAAFAVDGVVDAAAALLPRHGRAQRHALIGIVAPRSVFDAVRVAVECRLSAGDSCSVRVFEVLPRTDNGALSDAQLFLCFGRGRNGEEPVTVLEWDELASEQGQSARRFRTHVPERYAFFEGHFTTYPVLAGAVQLHELVLPCVRRVHPDAVTLQKLIGLKFMARSAPGDQVEGAIRPGRGPGTYHFEITRGDTRCSGGRLAFTTGDAR